MKRILLAAIPLLLSCSMNIAQDVQTVSSETKNLRKCGTMEYLEQQKALDPSVELQMQQLEEFTRQWIKDHPDGSGDKTIITVPVVVHVVWNTSAQNISDARVQEQINILNRDYGGTNPHSMGSFSTSLKANTELQFCLAQRTPAGVATNGIEKRQTTVTSFTTNNAVKYYSQGGLSAWDPTKYMNIWVCNLGQYLCGYAQFPYAAQGGGINATYGVVIHYQYFGVTGATTPYNGGGTTTHEIGHCFNLYHIWGDDSGGSDPYTCSSGNCCGGTDNCTDTPNQSVATDGSHTGELTDACATASPGIMYMNFMDYTYDVSYTNFTPNQKARIQPLFVTGAPLVSLKTSNGCTPGVGIEETESISDINIYPNPSNGLVNVKFTLSDASDVVISVSNILGDEIAKIGKQNVSSVDIPINLANQSAGIYFVKIQIGTQIITQKVSLIK
ncbi:MAG: T9SS type A sorting domain-containing protein [Bacteroidales bacterium]